jgi:hypothetical protein
MTTYMWNPRFITTRMGIKRSLPNFEPRVNPEKAWPWAPYKNSQQHCSQLLKGHHNVRDDTLEDTVSANIYANLEPNLNPLSPRDCRIELGRLAMKIAEAPGPIVESRPRALCIPASAVVAGHTAQNEAKPVAG